ncbi:hypothetical protein KUTeg_016518 [Tegillarca granosa]|uniref:RING-type domain-containing protein n=1 Tax=Tegillarca granosa TaxID=220873 RepID=A0ABQ9EL34_TEGGR|nr:hypothetical protein KUTeg_016518 [Tegillarca granosa]
MATYSAGKNKVDLAIDPLITCKLCLTECTLPEMYELHDCKCLYCERCVRQYLCVMITEGTVSSITCPDAQCKRQGRIEAGEIETLVDARLYARYKRLRFQKEVDLDPNRTFCPEVGCETVCHVCSTSTGESFRPIPVECPTVSKGFSSHAYVKSPVKTEETFISILKTLEQAGLNILE